MPCGSPGHRATVAAHGDGPQLDDRFLAPRAVLDSRLAARARWRSRGTALAMSTLSFSGAWLLGLVLRGARVLGCMTESARRPVSADHQSTRRRPQSRRTPRPAPAPDGRARRAPASAAGRAGGQHHLRDAARHPQERGRALRLRQRVFHRLIARKAPVAAAASAASARPAPPASGPTSARAATAPTASAATSPAAAACVSCNQPDRTGECMPVPAGQKDPREACRKEPERDLRAKRVLQRPGRLRQIRPRHRLRQRRLRGPRAPSCPPASATATACA